MQTKTVKDLKQGEYFRRIRSGKPTNVTYTRGEYCRFDKKYECANHDDMWGNGILLKGSTVVAVGFTY
jgi:hypothetical protein